MATPDTPVPTPTTSFPSPSPKPQRILPANLYSSRLSLPFDQRLLLANFFAMICGSVLGFTTASRLAGLRYRAENAHRMPTTRTGWYLYQKTKNYHRLRWGITAGLRSGFRLAGWTSLFFLVEEAVDIFRGTWRAGRSLREMEGVSELDIKKVDEGIVSSRDFGSSLVAGMVTAGVYSAWNQFPMATAARTIRFGVMGGLAFGFGQDGLFWARKWLGAELEDPRDAWLYNKGERGWRREVEGEDENSGALDE